jgi:putative membrane protein
MGLLGAMAFAFAGAAQAAGPTDPEIAHIAYTAGNIDIAAVNDKALALLKELNVTPKDNATSEALSKQAGETLSRFAKLSEHDFDHAYLNNEVTYHNTVNSALRMTLIPSAANGQLKSLLETGLTLFTEHQKHAEHLAKALK